jgi:signal transduction histidine kinase
MTDLSMLPWAGLVAGFLANGVALPLIGLWAWRRRPEDAASLALACACVPAGLLLLGAVDRHDQTALTRLYLAAAALLPAGLAQLALTFPTDRTRGHRTAALLALYLPSLALALMAQIVLTDPLARSAIDTVLRGAALVTGSALLLAVAVAAARGPTVLGQRRAALTLVGALGAASPGLALLLGDGASDGWMATHGAALTLWILPLAIAAAIAAPGLVEIDAVLRRTLSAAILTATVVATYALTQVTLAALDPDSPFVAASPAGIALLNVCVVFLIVPIRARAQALVDRLFAPAAFDGERLLNDLAHGLAASRTIDAVVAHARDVLAASLRPGWVRIYLPDGAERLHLAGRAPGPHSLAVPEAWRPRLARGEVVVVEDLLATGAALPPAWQRADAALVVPLRADQTLVGVLVLGSRPRRQPYGTRELAFLRNAGYQLALGLIGTRAFDQLDHANRRLAELNSALERQVAERTAALHARNAELQDSLAQLRRAYQQLERNHAGLLRAERLATLGRLTASLAHEINTPLSAVMNALKMVGDLAREYQSSIDDAAVLPADHHEIARELIATATAAAEWAGKAASHIRRIKSHGREVGGDTAQPFPIRDVVDEARGLVAHRLHLAGCSVEFTEEEPGLALTGDRTRFGQVLVNLFTNAVDAYEERGAGGAIAVRASRAAGGGVSVAVTDWAGGISPAVLPHIFNDLYTTKAEGHGTGLGLWIARTQIEEGFRGTLDVLSSNGSSCFVIAVPVTATGDDPAARPAVSARLALAAGASPAAGH